MYYLQNKPSTSFLCLVEPELWSLKDGVRANFFPIFSWSYLRFYMTYKKNKNYKGFFLRCSTTVPNFKTIRGGPWKNIKKIVELTWNDPVVLLCITFDLMLSEFLFLVIFVWSCHHISSRWCAVVVVEKGM